MDTFLGFDVGATKIAWGLFSENGKLVKEGRFMTPTTYADFLKAILETIPSFPELKAVGLGIPGTISLDHQEVIFCTNLSYLNGQPLAKDIHAVCQLPTTLDNDARCALIGEVWQGGASEYSSAVLLTIGSGIGGAVMQKGVIRPHPQDIGLEICRIIVDPTDVFPARTGPGSVEALIGGFNLETRFSIQLKLLAQEVRSGKPDAIDLWKTISYYFIQCMRTIKEQYNCSVILIGGVGMRDLDYYLQDPPPCPILPITLGEKAALYGATRIGIDNYESELKPEWE